MGRVTTFFGLSEEKPEVTRLAATFSGLTLFTQAAVVISTTFYLIFVAEALGNGDFNQGMALVAILVVIQMAVQTLFDYPTGVIGDWIGQRYILATAFLTYALAYFLVSLVTTSSPLWLLALIYALTGFAGSQQSGALGSWFDNNWRVSMPEDEGRKQYGVFVGKLGMLIWFTNVLILVPGGVLAAIFGRPWVFQLQVILCILISLLSVRLVKDLPEASAQRQTKPTFDEYKSLLREGVKYLFSSRYVTYLLIGTMLVNSCISVWGNLILFPMYYTYLLTDVAVAAMRTIVMLPLVFYSERSGVWAKRFKPEKWIPRFRFVQTCGAPPDDAPMIDYLLPGTDILILQVPLGSLLPVTLMILAFFIGGVFWQVAGVLTSRIFVDAIPNRVRNGVYSLFPTLVLLMGIPQILLFGWLISEVSISSALILIGFVSIIGVLMIRRAFTFMPPEIEVPVPE
ncbi:MAG: MFS transporter [Candidatus Hodarchaeota archaeon]